jgi:hypothetical protein
MVWLLSGASLPKAKRCHDQGGPAFNQKHGTRWNTSVVTTALRMVLGTDTAAAKRIESLSPGWLDWPKSAAVSELREARVEGRVCSEGEQATHGPFLQHTGTKPSESGRA